MVKMSGPQSIKFSGKCIFWNLPFSVCPCRWIQGPGVVFTDLFSIYHTSKSLMIPTTKTNNTLKVGIFSSRSYLVLWYFSFALVGVCDFLTAQPVFLVPTP